MKPLTIWILSTQDTFSCNRPSAIIKTSCCSGFCPDGSLAFTTAASSFLCRYSNRSTTGSSAIVFSCLKVKLEIICNKNKLDDKITQTFKDQKALAFDINQLENLTFTYWALTLTPASPVKGWPKSWSSLMFPFFCSKKILVFYFKFLYLF